MTKNLHPQHKGSEKMNIFSNFFEEIFNKFANVKHHTNFEDDKFTR